MNYISTRYRTFIIKFRGDSDRYIFDYSNGTLGDIINNHNKHGIEYLKEYDSVKDSFKSLTKAKIIATFDHDTHSIVELQKTGYIK